MDRLIITNTVIAAANWDAMNGRICWGLIPTNVSVKALAIVTAGLTKNVDDVSQ